MAVGTSGWGRATGICIRILGLLLGIAVVPAAPARAPGDAHPALWKIERGAAVIYLFGTIHLLPKGMVWHDRVIDAALARSHTLSLEVVVDQDPLRIATAFTRLASGKDLPPLAERVPAEKRATLAKLVTESGMNATVLDGMKSWAAGVILLTPTLKQIGLEPGSGVEPQLAGLFRANGKPIDELETPLEQFGYFDRLPESAQRLFLLQVLEEPAQVRAELSRMIAAWRAGDLPGIEKTFADSPEFTPQLRDALIVQRDRMWAAKLARRLEQPGVSFVAVGAGHLVGPDSVQAMLARQGIAVKRVQ